MAPVRPAKIAILAGATFVGVTTEHLPIGLLPAMSRDLGVTEATTGLLVTGYAVTVAATAIPLTAITRRIDRRALLTALLAVYAACCLATALAPSFAVMMTARILGGMAHGIFWSIVAAYAAALVGEHHRGRATATVFAGNAVGLALGIPMGAAAGDTLGYRTVFVLLAALSLALAMLTRLSLPRAAGDVATGAVDGLRTAWHREGLPPLATGTGLVMLGHFTFYTYIAVFLERTSGATTPAISGILFAFGVAGVASTLVVGRTVDRHLLAVTTGTLFAVAIAIAATTTWGQHIALTVASLTLWGAAYAALTVCLQASALRLAPQQASAASSLYVTFFNLGIAGGAWLGSTLLTALSLSALPVAALTALTAGSWLIITGLRRAARPVQRGRGAATPTQGRAAP